MLEIHAYVGGHIHKFDYYDLNMLMLQYFKIVAERGGVKHHMRCYTNADVGFIVIENDKHLKRICEKILKTSIEVNIFIMVGEENKNVGESESDEFSESCYDDEDDDTLFNTNIDIGAESIGDQQLSIEMLDDSMIGESSGENLNSSEDDLRSKNGSESETDSQISSLQPVGAIGS